MPFISSSELCSRIKALYRKTWYLNNPFLFNFFSYRWRVFPVFDNGIYYVQVDNNDRRGVFLACKQASKCHSFSMLLGYACSLSKDIIKCRLLLVKLMETSQGGIQISRRIHIHIYDICIFIYIYIYIVRLFTTYIYIYIRENNRVVLIYIYIYIYIYRYIYHYNPIISSSQFTPYKSSTTSSRLPSQSLY